MGRIRDFFDNIRHIDAILTKQAETQDYICSHLRTIADELHKSDEEQSAPVSEMVALSAMYDVIEDVLDRGGNLTSRERNAYMTVLHLIDGLRKRRQA